MILNSDNLRRFQKNMRLTIKALWPFLYSANSQQFQFLGILKKRGVQRKRYQHTIVRYSDQVCNLILCVEHNTKTTQQCKFNYEGLKICFIKTKWKNTPHLQIFTSTKAVYIHLIILGMSNLNEGQNFQNQNDLGATQDQTLPNQMYCLTLFCFF